MSWTGPKTKILGVWNQLNHKCFKRVFSVVDHNSSLPDLFPWSKRRRNKTHWNPERFRSEPILNQTTMMNFWMQKRSDGIGYLFQNFLNKITRNALSLVLTQPNVNLTYPWDPKYQLEFTNIVGCLYFATLVFVLRDIWTHKRYFPLKFVLHQ